MWRHQLGVPGSERYRKIFSTMWNPREETIMMLRNIDDEGNVAFVGIFTLLLFSPRTLAVRWNAWEVTWPEMNWFLKEESRLTWKLKESHWSLWCWFAPALSKLLGISHWGLYPVLAAVCCLILWFMPKEKSWPHLLPAITSLTWWNCKQKCLKEAVSGHEQKLLEKAPESTETDGPTAFSPL